MSLLHAAINKSVRNARFKIADQLKNNIQENIITVGDYSYYDGRTTRRRSSAARIKKVEGGKRDIYDSGRLYRSVRVTGSGNVGVGRNTNYAELRLETATGVLTKSVDELNIEEIFK